MNDNEIKSEDEISKLPELSKILDKQSDYLMNNQQRIVEARYKNLYFNLLKTSTLKLKDEKNWIS